MGKPLMIHAATGPAVIEPPDRFNHWWTRLTQPQAAPMLWDMVPMVLLLLAMLAGVTGAVMFPDYGPLLLLLPLAVILALVVVVRPELAVIPVVAYPPFESDIFNQLYIPGGLSIGKLSGAVLIAAFAVGVLIRNRRFRILDDKQDLTIILFLALMLFSGVVSYYPAKTFEGVTRMLRMVVLYLTIKNLTDSLPMIYTVLWSIVLSGTYASMWGINEYFELNAIRNFDIRARGIYMDPNGYAAIAVTVVAYALALLQTVRHRSLRVLLVMILLINVGGIFLSASRGGLIALIVIGMVFVWRHPRRMQLMAAILAVILFSFPFWPESIKIRLFGTDTATVEENPYQSTAEFSAKRRTSYIEYGITLISRHPLLGTGYSTFSYLYPYSEFARLDNPMDNLNRYRPSHNAFLEIAVGMGLMGLVIFLLIWLVSWHDLYQVGQVQGRNLLGLTAQGVELGLIGLAITSFFLPAEAFDYTWVSFAMASSLANLNRIQLSLPTLPPDSSG